MKTIILCGGRGIRLNEETEFVPKPMVKIGEKPIIWHIMKLYEHFGYNEFILALGYKAELIKQYFLNEKTLTSDFTISTKTCRTKFYLNNRKQVDNFHITFADTGTETLIGERILLCERYIPKDEKFFMVTYGDGVANLNIDQLLKFHKKTGTIGTITGIHPKSKYGLVKAGKNNLITSFKEKPQLRDWINGGFMVFSREFFKYIRTGEMEHPALQRLSKINELSLYRHTGFWYSVDTNKELEELRKIWNLPNPPWKLW